MRTRRLLPAALLAALILAPVARAAISQTPDVTDTRFSSVLLGVHPVLAGVSWKVIDRNDELALINHSSQTVTIYGYSASPATVAYDGGQYARILPDGTVQVNENSPAYYLNQSFLAQTANVPASATATAPPNWVTLARTAQFTWHDHRIHYTGLGTPAVVTDVHRRTYIFDWYVPIQVGVTRGFLHGKLYWIGERSFSFPIGAIIALIVIVIAAGAFVYVVRRRRGPRAPREAW